MNNARRPPSDLTLTVMLCLLTAATTVPSLNAAPFIANPTFQDGNGDGLPDGWEMKTFVIESWKKSQPCISMNIPRKDKTPFTGEMSTVFPGPAGFYRITVNYLDEWDGISKAKLLVNGKILHIWNFDGTFADCWRDEVIENVELAAGDRITLWGRDNPSEYCRIRSITAEPSPNPPTAAELEEMRNPPSVGDARLAPLVSLAEQRDIAALERKPEYAPLITGGSLRFLSKGNETVQIHLRFQPFRMEPAYSLLFFGAEAAGLEKGTIILDHRNISTGGDGETVLVLKTAEPGLYGLEIHGSNFHVEMDLPHVFPAPSPGKNATLLRSTGTFYFFIPRHVTAFGIGAFPNGDYVGEVTVRDPEGALVTRMDVPKTAPYGIPIRIRPGQDGQVWSVRIEGVSPVIRLFGVPPYLARHPRYLLIPEYGADNEPIP